MLHGYNLPHIIKPKPLEITPKTKICILAPHADDETIGCGGLLKKYGSQCDVILLTDGSKGGVASSPDEVRRIREAEFIQVMEYYKVHKYHFMRAKDGDLISGYDLFKQLDFTPYDYVFMPHRQDCHKDHVVPQGFFRRLKRTNLKIRAKAVYYEVWGALPMPTHYLDISDVYSSKTEAMSFYKSQGNIDYADRILALNHYRGIRHHVAYAESYTIA